MNLVREESIDAVASSAVTEQLPERNDERRESQVSPQAAIHHLVTGRFAADIVGVAAELGLADQIQSGPKTAEEIAAAMGLHASSLYRLLRALANFGSEGTRHLENNASSQLLLFLLVNPNSTPG